MDGTGKQSSSWYKSLVNNKFLSDVAIIIISGIVTVVAMQWVMDDLNPTSEKKKAAAARKAAMLSKIVAARGPLPGLNSSSAFSLATLDLDDYEALILCNVVNPLDVDATFDDIGGLDGVVAGIRECVTLPLTRPSLFQVSRHLRPPKGILLYGPPGTGKTMLAKAIARESNAVFLNLSASTLQDMWYGESTKIVKAVFTLAQKLAPCIIFIDEIDSFLRQRSQGDHEATASIKSEFMMLWDGLASDESSNVIVLGATNRPEDIDPAFLRRMPRQFEVGLPAAKSRESILRLLLKDDRLEDGFDFHAIAEASEGLSGSDLKELCRLAWLAPVRDLLAAERTYALGEGVSESPMIRSVTTQDFLTALSHRRVYA